jgi:hypothetical protein
LRRQWNCANCNDKNFLLECVCGCLGIISRHGKNGGIQRYIKGHQSRGKLHYNYKGGYLTNLGYITLPKRDHHFANSNGDVLKHRLVWEEYNRAVLLPWAHVHHKNENRQDNRIENLWAMMKGQHASLHNYLIKRKDMSDRKCRRCGRTKTGKRDGRYQVWCRHPVTKEEWYCRSCGTVIQRQLKRGN